MEWKENISRQLQRISRLIVNEKEGDYSRLIRNYQRLFCLWQDTVKLHFDLDLFIKSFSTIFDLHIQHQEQDTDYKEEHVSLLWKMLEIELFLHNTGKLPVPGVLWPSVFIRTVQKLFPIAQVQSKETPLGIIEKVFDLRESKPILSLFIISYCLSVADLWKIHSISNQLFVIFAQSVSKLEILRSNSNDAKIWTLPHGKFLRDILRLVSTPSISDSVRMEDLSESFIALSGLLSTDYEFSLTSKITLTKSIHEISTFLLRCIAKTSASSSDEAGSLILAVIKLTIHLFDCEKFNLNENADITRLVRATASLAMLSNVNTTPDQIKLYFSLIACISRMEYKGDLFWLLMKKFLVAISVHIRISQTRDLFEITPSFVDIEETLIALESCFDPENENSKLCLKFCSIASRFQNISVNLISDDVFLTLFNEDKRLAILSLLKTSELSLIASLDIVTYYFETIGNLTQHSNWRMKLHVNHFILPFLFDALAALTNYEYSSLAPNVMYKIANAIFKSLHLYFTLNWDYLEGRLDYSFLLRKIIQVSLGLPSIIDKSSLYYSYLYIVDALVRKTEHSVEINQDVFAWKILMELNKQDDLSLLVRPQILNLIKTWNEELILGSDTVLYVIRFLASFYIGSADNTTMINNVDQIIGAISMKASGFTLPEKLSDNARSFLLYVLKNGLDSDAINRLTSIKNVHENLDDLTLSKCGTSFQYIAMLHNSKLAEETTLINRKIPKIYLKSLTHELIKIEKGDVRIIVQNETETCTIFADKLSLMAHSETMNAMLKENFKEGISKEIKISDFSNETVLWLISFMQHRSFPRLVEENLNMILELFYLAEFYIVKKVKFTCISWLCEMITSKCLKYDSLIRVYTWLSTLDEFTQWTPATSPVKKSLFKSILIRVLLYYAPKMLESKENDDISSIFFTYNLIDLFD